MASGNREILSNAKDRAYLSKQILANCVEWQEIDQQVALNLAICLSDINALQSQLDQEGYIIFSRFGTAKPNPKYKIVEKLIRRSIALSRRFDEIREGYLRQIT